MPPPLNRKSTHLVQQTLRAKLSSILEDKQLPHIHVPTQVEPYEGNIPQSVQHALPEIFFQLSGTNRFYCDSQTIDLQPGEVCIMPAGVPHREEVLGSDFSALVLFHDLDRFVIHIMEGQDGQRPWGFRTNNYLTDQSKQLSDLLSITADAFIRKAKAGPHLLRSYIALILEIYDMHPKDRIHAFSPLVTQCVDLFFTEFSSTELSLNSAARRLNCNADSLSARFSRETGKTALEYLTNLRIEKSKHLLHNSAKNISEIAWACGYKDPNYFSRLFKKQTKTTPRQYRNSNTP